MRIMCPSIVPNVAAMLCQDPVLNVMVNAKAYGDATLTRRMTAIKQFGKENAYGQQQHQQQRVMVRRWQSPRNLPTMRMETFQ